MQFCIKQLFGEKTMLAGFKKKSAVTLPLFKFANNVPMYVRFENPMFKSEPLKKASAEEKKKDPPTLAHVVNLETGDEGQIILGSVLAENLNKHYPDNGYVGKSFEIIKHPQEGGRAYCLYSITEIDTADADQAEPKAESKAARNPKK